VSTWWPKAASRLDRLGVAGARRLVQRRPAAGVPGVRVDAGVEGLVQRRQVAGFRRGEERLLLGRPLVAALPLDAGQVVEGGLRGAEAVALHRRQAAQAPVVEGVELRHVARHPLRVAAVGREKVVAHLEDVAVQVGLAHGGDVLARLGAGQQAVPGLQADGRKALVEALLEALEVRQVERMHHVEGAGRRRDAAEHPREDEAPAGGDHPVLLVGGVGAVEGVGAAVEVEAHVVQGSRVEGLHPARDGSLQAVDPAAAAPQQQRDADPQEDPA
jgi:hypothetical protein